MTNRNNEEVRELWNRLALDWDLQVGDDGDTNRRLNSDPILWRFLGEVQGLRVLDAGCGTGYLSRKLANQGAIVTGIDAAEKMIEIAQRKASEQGQTIDFRVDSCAKLESLESDYFDLLVSNYVLMDVPDLEDTVSEFNRVLKPDGSAVLVFSHPCFPGGRATFIEQTGGVVYSWDFSYFDRQKRIDPPWKHFTSDFIWFHRPLSDYWKAFRKAGFDVTDFEEPRITEERFHLAESEKRIQKSKACPYSVAFKLRKI